MKRAFIIFTIIIIGKIVSGQVLSSPIDIIYDSDNEYYYVTNYNNGDGYITKHDVNMNVLSVFADNLYLVGGLCIENNTLYVLYNLAKPSQNQPCYLKAFVLESGLEIFTKEIASDGFVNLMDKDENGNLYFGDQNHSSLIMYNIYSETFETLIEGIHYIFGVHYHPVDNKIYFISASSGVSKVYSIAPESSDYELRYNHSGEADDLVIDPEDNTLFLSSWEIDHPSDSLGKVFYTEDYYNEDVLGYNHVYPFGMCIGKDRKLLVCNTGSSTISTLYLNTGISGNEIKQSLKVFPNPNEGFFNIEIPEGKTPEYIEIYDVSGRIIYTEKNQFILNANYLNIDISSVPSGMYLIQVYTEKEVLKTKFMIK